MQTERPARMIVELTDRCNLQCIHCFANKHDSELEKEQWKYIFQKSIDEGISSISITGGEPLLFKGLFDIFDSIDSKNTKITLDSNGTLIDENNIEKLKKHFKLVRISIYGNNSEDSKRITRVPNYDYKKILNAIKLLSKYEIKIQINIPLFNENIDHMEEILSDLEPLNLYEIVFIPILGIGFAHDLKDLPSQEEIEQLYLKYRNRTRAKLRLFKWAEGKHFLVRSDGKVYLHPFYIDGKATDLYLGNIMDNSIDDLWKNVEEQYKINNITLTPNLDDL